MTRYLRRYCCCLLMAWRTEIYTLSLHDALPIWMADLCGGRGRDHADRVVDLRAAADRAPRIAAYRDRCRCGARSAAARRSTRSEEHTSELQSRRDLVCRLLLEKKKRNKSTPLVL